MKPQFIKIVFGALYVIYQRKSVLFKALILPFILFLLLDFATLSNPPQILICFIFIAKLALYTVYAIITHRIILLGENSVPRWGFITWSKRESLFILYLFALILITTLAFMLALIEPYLGLFLGVVVSVYVTARLSLVFPAIAIDNKLSLKSSWSLSNNHQLLVVLVVALFPVLFTIPNMVLSLLPYSFGIVSLFDTFTTVIVIASLSIAYNEIYQYEMQATNTF